MSPEAKRTFELEWAVLSRRLRLLLVRKRVDPSLHDDLVQETALRLLSMWDSVDRRRPLWPLTVTIALNLLRDRGRVVHRDDLVADIPEGNGVNYVEAAGLARVELERVRRAMGELSRSQRSALMKEVGSHALANSPDSSGEKMLRMRARRKLKMALENVSGLVALRLRRVVDLIEGAFAVREGAFSAASCVFCLVIGFGATVAQPVALTPEASAGALDAGSPFGSAEVAAIPQQSTFDVSTAAEPRAGHAAANVGVDASQGTERKPGHGSGNQRDGRGGSQGDAADDSGFVNVLPQQGDEVVPAPSSDQVGVQVGGDGAPPLPNGGDDDTLSPPSPTPPAPPPPPPVPVNAGVPLPPVAEETESLL